MIAVISPSVISGSVTAPASKSAMQRACALALLNNGITIIKNPGKSNDDVAAINIIKQLGATLVYQTNGDLQVTSNGKVNYTGEINCWESGLSLRMFAAIAALSDQPVILSGEGSLLKRPMGFFDEIFPLLKVSIGSDKGFLPINIKGPLEIKNITFDASLSSQYLTGILFAFAKAAQHTVTVKVNNLKSKPYIDLSIEMLDHFGYHVQHKNYTEFTIDPVAESQKEIIYCTEGDWSGAAFLLVAGATAGAIKVQGLDINSTQADKAIITVLQSCGADLKIDNDYIAVNAENKLEPFSFDATDCPDLFPPLVALAASCKGTSIIKGVSRLVAKESDREKALTDVFWKMNIKVITEGDTMIIKGGTGIKAATVNAHHDHRIAMACAIAGLNADGKMVIHDAAVVSKSYPDFFEHLKLLGAAVSLSDQ